MPVDFPFHNLEPTFFAGLLDDPVLLVRTRSTGRTLMFDCGQLHHLAKRTFTRLDAIFVSHAHMDHWMGIDTVVRQLLTSGRTIDLFGPPGLAERLGHKLQGYDWNLVEDSWCSFVVHEITATSLARTWFPGSAGFKPRTLETLPATGAVIYRTPHLQVRAACGDHDIASFFFRVDERPAFLIDRQQLAAEGLLPGRWLGELKKRYYAGHLNEEPLEVEIERDGSKTARTCNDVHRLSERLVLRQAPRSLGYLSDLGMTAANRQAILGLLSGVDLLVGECTFLRADCHRARGAKHLCTDDVNQLLEDVRPRFFLPMHLSKSYRSNWAELYEELAPPAGTTILELPMQRTPRPLLASEIDWMETDR